MGGTALYSAYFKATPYRKILVASQLVLAVFSLTDWLLVYAIKYPEKTVFGVDARFFAVFGEAAQDVMLQIKLMPMLVLAAQVCPDSIEGTLFAFIMGAQSDT